MNDFPDLSTLPPDASVPPSRVLDMLRNMPELPPVIVPSTPDHDRRTAQNTKAMAEATEQMRAYLGTLLDATNASIKLSADAREDAKAAQRTSRNISIASLVVSIAATAAAFGSLVISIVALAR